MPCRRRWSAASTRSRALCRVRSRPACKAPSSRSRRRSTASSTRRSFASSTKLNQLISKIDAKIEPAFTQLQSLANIHIGEDFATIDDVKVNVTAIGISDANAFVGMPPAGGFDFSKLIAEQTAIGLFIQNLNMALGFFKPVLGKQLPNFTALKLTADSAGFTDGGAGILDIVAQGITVDLNLGGKLVQGIPFATDATIDFPESFKGDLSVPGISGCDRYDDRADLPGFRRRADPRERCVGGDLDFRVRAHRRQLRFREGPDRDGRRDWRLGDWRGERLPGSDSNLQTAISIPATGADTTQLSFMTLGAADVHAFVGLHGPYWTDTQRRQDSRRGRDQYGRDRPRDRRLRFRHGDHAADQSCRFRQVLRVEGERNEITLVGIEGVTVKAENLLVEVNQSSPSIYGVPLFPVVDFASTYGVDEQQALFDVFDADERSPDLRTRADRGTEAAYARSRSADDGRRARQGPQRRRRAAGRPDSRPSIRAAQQPPSGSTANGQSQNNRRGSRPRTPTATASSIQSATK